MVNDDGLSIIILIEPVPVINETNESIMCPLIMTAIPPDLESAIVSCGMEPVMFNKPEPLDTRNRFVQLSIIV